MALVVENGDGLPNAESYISVDDATAYLTAIGEGTEWSALSVAEQEAALRLATSWIDGHYGWPGQIKVNDQALAWPRVGAIDCDERLIDPDSVPVRVANATAWVAKEGGTGAIDLSSVNTDGRIKRTHDKVGPLESEIEYESGGAPGGEVSLPFVDSLLRCLYTTKMGNSQWSTIRTVRA